MIGTPEPTKDWVRGYYVESTELYLKNWGGSSRALHLGLDDGTCPTRDDALAASNAYLADRAGIHQGTRVLDAGCGVGGSSMWLAKQRGANVVGITISPVQVPIATRLTQEAGLASLVSFHEMDFAATTFSPGSFDVVWNLESMVHAFDKREYLRHILTLLRPGGRFACLEPFSSDGQEDADAVKTMCRSWSLPSLPSVAQVRGWLADVGFVDVESEDLTDRVRRPCQALHAMALNAIQMLKIEKTVTGSCSAVYEAHVLGGIACAEGVEQGVIEYAYVGARKPGGA